MKYAILIAIISTIGIKAFAQSDSTKPDWTYIGTGTTDSSLIYLKSEPVFREGNVIRIWSKMKVPKRTIDKIVYTNVEAKDLWEFNCQDQSVRLFSTVTFDSNGKVIQSGNFQSPLPNYIIPGSVGEWLMNAACKMK